MLKQLIGYSKNEPYSMWPNVDQFQKTNLLYTKAKVDEEHNETFIIVKNGITQLYFQFHKLEWDTNHFKFNCEKICNCFIDCNLEIKEIDLIVKEIKPKIYNYLKSNNTTFVFADIPSLNIIANLFVQKLGFAFILNWLDGFVLSENVHNITRNYEFGNILPKEIEQIVNISSKNYYKGGRFYLDKKFDKKTIDQLYGSLIKTSIENKNDVLICRKEGKPIGAFISNVVKEYTSFSKIKVAGLRFLVLDPKYRGMNIGSELFSAILNYYNGKTNIITTGLESHNLISLNLHIKKGFKFNYSHNAYHLWI